MEDSADKTPSPSQATAAKEPSAKGTGSSRASAKANQSAAPKAKAKPKARARKRAVKAKSKAVVPKASAAAKPKAKPPAVMEDIEMEDIEVEPIVKEPPRETRESPPPRAPSREREPWEGRHAGGEEEPRRRQGGSAALFGGFARRLVSQGVEAFGLGEEVARNLVNDKVTKESVAGLMESAIKSKEEVGRFKDELQRATLKGKEEVGRLRGDVQKAMTREVRRQLERVDLKEEISKVLADYQLEITARIHFVPRDDDQPESQEEEEGSPELDGKKKKRRGRKRKKEDVQIRLSRKRGMDEVEMLPEDEPVDEPLTPDGYFDDDDDDFDEY